MSLVPDSWCLPGNLPRHKLRAYGRISTVHGGAEYRRLLNFLSKHASQGERELLNVTPVPTFAQVPPIVNRRLRAPQNPWTPPVADSKLQYDTQPLPEATPPVEELLNEVAPQFISDMRSDPQPMDGLLKDIPVQQFVLNEILNQSPQYEMRVVPNVHVPVQQPANNICFAPESDLDFSITITDVQTDFAVSNDRSPRVQGPSQRAIARLQRFEDRSKRAAEWAQQMALDVTNRFELELAESVGATLASEPPAMLLHADVPTEVVDRVASVPNEDGQFLGHLSVLLNEWFDKENLQEEAEPVPQGLDTPEKRRERTYAMLRKAAAERRESKRLMEKFGKVSPEGNPSGRTTSADSNANDGDRSNVEPLTDRRSSIDRRSTNSKSGLKPVGVPVPKPGSAGFQRASGRGERHHPGYAENRRRARGSREVRHETARQVLPLPNGMRKEELGDGSFVLKDAVGRVTEARSHDGAIMSFSYDNRGHLKSFVRSDISGKIHTTGLKDKHGVIVRDDHGSLKAQGDSMTVDTNGCVSIRKFDGQFWSLDVLRGIHIERRILEDVNGNWNCLTALLTCDGFRMVTRFQKMQESKRESYRKYGDWLGGLECSKFRFYGRDGSMIEFENDEDLEALRPSRIWPAGSRPVEREWMGRRQAGTAWDAVHRYISQYLSAL